MPSPVNKPKCSTGKTVFLSLSEVEMFLHDKPNLRHYPCERCSYYHVTSMSERDANKYFGAKPLKYSELFKKYMK